MSKASVATKVEKASAKASKVKGSTPAVKPSKTFEAMKVVETRQVDPSKLVMREQKLRGRVQDVSHDELATFADSLKTRQNQPIQIRVTAAGDEVLFGNMRTLAGRLLQSGFKYEVNGKEVEVAAIPDFTLRAEVVDVDDEEAFLRTVTENAQRIQTTAIDDAVNHETLRTDYSMSDAAITRLYGYGHQASVTQLKKLLTLPLSFQTMIHTGTLTKNAGLLLVDHCKKKGEVSAETNICNEEFCNKIFGKTSATGDNGTGVNDIQAGIKAFEVEAKQAAAGTAPVAPASGTAPATNGTAPATNGTAAATPAVAPTVFPLTLKQYRDMLEEFAGLKTTAPKLGEFIAVTMGVLKGETDKAAYYEWLAEAFATPA